MSLIKEFPQDVEKGVKIKKKQVRNAQRLKFVEKIRDKIEENKLINKEVPWTF